MKHTMTFDSEDMHDMELFRRCNVADKMARILHDCVNQDGGLCSIQISEESSKHIREACWDNGINFDEIYT